MGGDKKKGNPEGKKCREWLEVRQQCEKVDTKSRRDCGLMRDGRPSRGKANSLAGRGKAWDAVRGKSRKVGVREKLGANSKGKSLRKGTGLVWQFGKEETENRFRTKQSERRQENLICTAWIRDERRAKKRGATISMTGLRR